MDPEDALFGMPAERGRWGLVIVGMIINLCLGTIYSGSVFSLLAVLYGETESRVLSAYQFSH